MSFKLKYVTAICLLSFSTLAAANHHYKDEVKYKDAVPCPSCATLMGGWYVGAQLGYDAYEVRQNVDVAALGFAANPHISATGFVGGLFLGYGQYWDQWYLGGEIFANSSNADSSWSASILNGADTYHSKFEVNGSYGIALLPGFKFTEATLTYIRLGYNWAKFKFHESESFTPSSASKSDTEGGFNYGIGMETLLWMNSNWSLRAEYTHTNYGSFSTALAPAAPSTAVLPNSHTKVDPSDNQFMLGLIYHF